MTAYISASVTKETSLNCGSRAGVFLCSDCNGLGYPLQLVIILLTVVECRRLGQIVCSLQADQLPERILTKSKHGAADVLTATLSALWVRCSVFFRASLYLRLR